MKHALFASDHPSHLICQRVSLIILLDLFRICNVIFPPFFQDTFQIDIWMENDDAGGGGDSSFWADSESDFELSNFDPEVGPSGSESWKCVTCKTPNEMKMRYCHKCWEVCPFYS